MDSINNELSIIEETKTPIVKEYSLANIYRVFFARLFDIIISSIPGFVSSILIVPDVDDWGMMFLSLSIAFVFLFSYFIVLPYFMNGDTIGKKIFGIRLIKNDDTKIQFKHLLTRESIFILLPWLIMVISQIISIVVFKKYEGSDGEELKAGSFIALIINQIGYLGYALFLLMIGISIAVQSQHQSVIDMKLGLFVIRKPKQVFSYDKKEITKKEMPGVFSKEKISQIYEDEEQIFNKKINVEEKKIIDHLKIDQDKHKKIETRDEDE
ncbi:RDD family protein [Mesoplasma photuris]|uniref:RDD family protein n=1 Tax=Mesoplasma photuris TaxID=217731 RepID=UPI0004E28950|nr:RDD family protein [Mesoplasma photuris]